jgi:signal transduction histidine kinase
MRDGSTMRTRLFSKRETEIGRLEARLAAMAEELALEGHARARFIGRVSHELRTPITVIKGYVYTLGRTQTDSETLAKLDVINGECERLAYLVEDLLELSRTRSGGLRVASEVFRLRDCLDEVVERLQTVADGRRVRLELHWDGDTPLVRGDQNRVRQIFANLLTNGIKYGPPDTAVTVTGEVRGGEVAVAIEDRGRGIAESDLPYVFDEFFQVPGRSEPGIGLGLAVARDLAEAHGGTIDVRSTLGRGTCFTVRLPVSYEGEGECPD